MPTTLWFAEACTGALDGVGLRDAAKYVAVSSILGLYCCVLGFGRLYLARPPVGTYLTTCAGRTAT